MKIATDDQTRRPIKCAAKNYVATPAYSLQTDGTSKRFVVTFAAPEEAMRLIQWFIEEAPNGLQIKVCDLSGEQEPVEYPGFIQGSRLKEVLTDFRAFFLHDGFHELMLRIPESGEYLAFDDHGILFLYTDQDYAPLLEAKGFPYCADRTFIYQLPHWHVHPAGSEKMLQDLIKTAELSPA